MMRRFLSLIFCVALCTILIWLLGQLVSDRWFWSQWLLWIPTIFVLLVLLLSASILAQFRDKRRSAFLGILFFVLTCYFLFIENSVLTTNSVKGEVTIAAWTMSHAKAAIAENSAELIVQLDPDIMLMTHGWHVRGEEAIQLWLGGTGKKLISGPFTLLTKFRPLEIRTLVASDGIYISIFKFDTTKQLGRELVLYAIDLPSNFLESKANIVRRASRLLQKVDAQKPDVVIGDFNMTRNSTSMQQLFPSMVDAWDSGGIGWSSSYHRTFPLFHIDHTLVSENLQVISYKLVDPELGRHCIQLVEISR